MKRMTVGVNDFVRRQVKGTGKTYSSLSYQEMILDEHLFSDYPETYPVTAVPLFYLV